MTSGRVRRRSFFTFSSETIANIRMLSQELLVFVRMYPDGPRWLRPRIYLLSGGSQL